MGMACLYLRHQIPANTPLTWRCSWSCREPHRLAFSESTAHHSNSMLNTACEDFVAGQGKSWESGSGRSLLSFLRCGRVHQANPSPTFKDEAGATNDMRGDAMCQAILS